MTTTQHESCSLINDTNPDVVQRIGVLGQRFTAILPIILTHQLLEYCETHPDDFVTAVGGGLERLGERTKLIARAKKFIEDHLAEQLFLGQIAEAMKLSPFYFCKFFKRETGLNFTEFVSKMRIEKAKNLLLNPNYRISEIAWGAGFKSLTHFNRVFKKLVGEAPTAYRKRVLSPVPPTADIRNFADIG